MTNKFEFELLLAEKQNKTKQNSFKS